MNDREKKIAAVTIALAAVGLLYYFWFLPWSEARTKTLNARTTLQGQLASAKKKIAERPAVEKKWSSMDAALKKAAQEDDTSLYLIGTMVKLTESLGINLNTNGQTSQDISAATTPAPKGSAPAKAQAFREVKLETKFDCSWKELIKLLEKISEDDNLLRTRRLSVRADEKTLKLDVELRVTTIERKKS